MFKHGEVNNEELMSNQKGEPMRAAEVVKMEKEFEKKHGTDEFLKASLEAVTQVLVKNGIKEEDLREAFVERMKRRENS